MPQSQVYGGHSSDDSSADDQGAGQVSLQTSTSEADALLDEIDSMLDTNAEEFVLSFIQKGGQ